jgi:RNA polymerase sigma factor (sigma-70 family)
MSCDSDQLLQALNIGASDAYKQLYDRYYNLLYYKSLSLVKDESVAKDMVQETLIQVWEKKLYANVQTSLDALLFVVLVRKCQYYLRRESRIREHKSNFAYVEKQHTSTNHITQYLDNKAEKEHFHEIARKLPLAFSQLPTQQQNAIDFVYFQKKSYAEAASLSGITLNTLKTHLKRAVKKMRDEFQ